MRLSMILATAGAEIRSVRRLARYWVFAILSVLITFAIYLYYAAIHGFLSRLSATVGAIGPRYLMTAMGIYIVAIFLLGLIFLVFDIRARDERERMAEVLDARPMSNVELLAGRGLGVLLMALAPVLFVAISFQVFGSLALAFGWYMGEPVQPYSLLGFLLHAISVFAPWCAAVALLAVLLRNRLVVALAALALIGIQFWGSFRLPIYLQPAFGALFPTAPTTSDLVPSVIGGQGMVRFVALLALAGALLMLAAAFHPRRDGGSKSGRLAIGGGLLAVASLLIGGIAWQQIHLVEVGAGWLAAHQARSQEPRPDLQAVSGLVRIDPGRRLDLDLEIQVRAPGDRGLDTLLFTFNPGLEVERVTLGGAEAPWTHEAGLLEITLPAALAPGGSAAMTLTASGVPDDRFGYLDSAANIVNGTVLDANLALFGIYSGLFSPRYVALMPGQGWLPRPGTDVPGADPRTNPADPFELDLEVEVPGDWLVAGPGRREVVSSGDDTVRFRFHPGAPLTEVGLLASRFERRAMEVAGVEFELLVYPGHTRNLRLFAEVGDELADRVEAMFTDAARLGLPYPYGALTLVESPSALRGYGGGWRMDTTQAMPGILLLRENSFTTSRFEFEFRNPAAYEDLDGGIARAKVGVLERFFENDVSGGNVFLGGSRNFLLFQTGARGEGALGLNFVVDELVNLLLTGKRGFFSPFLFTSQLNAAAGQVVQDVVQGQTETITQAVANAAADRPSVWQRALEVSIADLEPSDNPEQTLDVLTVKAPALARSILDGLGREKTAALLAGLLSRYRGGQFTVDQFRQVAIDVGADLDPLLGDWLHETSLPGFVPSPVVVERLADDDRGLPRYQTRVHVFDGEETPGLLRLRYTRQGAAAPGSVNVLGIANIDVPNGGGWDRTDPVRVGGHETVEIGIVTQEPLRELWLEPYLSLNRYAIRLTLPAVDARASERAEPFRGVRASTWSPPVSDAVIVDDLDPGFSVESDQAESGVRLSAAVLLGGTAELDQGLPEFSGNGRPPQWSRLAAPLGWGKYRRTVAAVGPGTGRRRGVFAATLPRAGRWRLAYHLPAGVLPALGAYDLTVRTGGAARAVEFDGGAAQGGWNVLGEFDLAAGETRVEVSDSSSGNLVVADAIRWEPVQGEE